MAVCRLEVIHKFRGYSVVCGVSLQVPECCVYGLLGPNGAGKSKILKMLTGILRPTKPHTIMLAMGAGQHICVSGMKVYQPELLI